MYLFKKGIAKVVFPILLVLVLSLSSQPPSASAHHSNDFANFPTLTQGSKGEYVEFLQAFLNTAGYSAGLIDGNFGSNTKSAVISFQKFRGITADGIVGDGTWREIRKYFKTSQFTSDQIIAQRYSQYVYVNISSDFYGCEDSEGPITISSGYLR